MAEVGNGQVAIFPTFKGFRKAVNAETEAAGKQADSGFRRIFGKTGEESGKTTGTGFRKAFESTSTGYSEKALKELQSAVSRSTKLVSDARLKEQDLAGRVRVAERQLAEARDKYATDSSRVVAAEERLESASRKLADQQQRTKGATEDLKNAQQRLADAADRSGDELENAGRRGGNRFGSGFATVFKGAFVANLASNAVSSITNAVQNAIGEGLRAAQDYIVQSVDAASMLQQSMGGVDAVFKDSAGTIHDWAQSAHEDVGLSQNAFNELSTVLGAQLKNLDVPMEDVAGKTGELITLGADLAAQFGGTTTDAVSALSSLLRGERDPIERYGVTINEAAVKAEALSKGLVTITQDADKVTAAQIRAEVAQTKYNDAVAKYGKNSTQAKSAQASMISANSALDKALEGNTSELTAAQKAAATLSLLYEQTADAQGTFTRESDTLAGQQQRLNAAWEDAQAKLGMALIPALTDLVTIANEELMPAFSDMLEQIGPDLAEALAESAPDLIALAEAFIDMLPALVDLAREGLPVLLDALELVLPWVSTFVDWLTDTSESAGGMMDLLNAADFTDFINALETIGGPLGAIWDLLTDIGEAAADLLANPILAAVDWVTGGAVSELNDALAGTRGREGGGSFGGFADVGATAAAALGKSTQVTQENHYEGTDPAEAAELANQQLDDIVRRLQ